MMRYSKLITKTAIGAVAGLMLFATGASATNYNISDVINGIHGGLKTTNFHEATSNYGMAGKTIESASDGNALIGGFYDDVSKMFEYSFNLVSGNSVSGVGTLDFSVDPDELIGIVVTTFDDAPILGSVQKVFSISYFQHNYEGDANSFEIGLGGLAMMTLWGAEGSSIGHGLFDSATTTIGSDLQFAFEAGPRRQSVVPVPAALPMFGAGLGIMGFIGWRRKQKAAAA